MEERGFGAWLGDELYRLGIKQSELAEITGVSRQQISRLIHSTENPHKGTKKKIIAALAAQQAVGNVKGTHTAEVYAMRFSDLVKQMIDLFSEILQAQEHK